MWATFAVEANRSGDGVSIDTVECSAVAWACLICLLAFVSSWLIGVMIVYAESSIFEEGASFG